MTFDRPRPSHDRRVYNYPIRPGLFAFRMRQKQRRNMDAFNRRLLAECVAPHFTTEHVHNLTMTLH